MIRRLRNAIIRRSCVTGNAVWIYSHLSKTAVKKAYIRACRHEMERVRSWSQTAARRKSNILGLLSSCLSELSVVDQLPEEKRAAAHRLTTLSNQGMDCYREFYDHIVEERRRHADDKKIRRRMRERENHKNNRYDK